MLNIWRKNFIIRNSSIRFKQTYLLTSIDIHVVLKKKKKSKTKLFEAYYPPANIFS